MRETADALERLDDAWRPFRAAIERLGPMGLERATPAGWTAKEMLATVAFWDECVVPVLQYMLRGQEIPRREWFGSGFMAPEDRDWPPDYEHNAREAEWARGQPAEAVVARAEQAHAAAAAMVASLPDEEATQRAGYLKDQCDHYGEHLAELQASPGT
ncbi:MAG: DinB family protein [Tepidiformaceae bacterium]